jgi:hypothetical protein
MRISSLRRTVFPVICSFALFAFILVLASRTFVSAQQRQAPAVTSPDVMPHYDTKRNLVLPDDYRRWVLVGSSLGLSYAEGGQAGHQMFNTTLIEPSAYRHFVETGTFREGTMFALIGQGIGTNATPARQGQFATDVHMLEMAVKDSKRVPEGWAYYSFGGPMMGGYLTSAAPEPKVSCYACHAQHAARDNVFTQFYGLLNEAAPRYDRETLPCAAHKISPDIAPLCPRIDCEKPCAPVATDAVVRLRARFTKDAFCHFLEFSSRPKRYTQARDRRTTK